MITSHKTDINIAFYNDKIKEVMDAGIMAEPFTYIPIKAGHMELVGGNAIVFGKITEGYDVITLDVETELSYQAIGALSPMVYLSVKPFQINEIINVNPPGPCFEYRTIVAVLTITLPSKIYVGNTYFVNVVNLPEEINAGASYVATGGDTLADLKANLETAMTTAGIEVVVGSPANQIYIYEINQTFCNDPYEYGDADTIFSDYNVSAYITSFGFSSKFPQLKRGAVHAFGIVYKDRSGRICSVIKDKALDIYIPFYAEEETSLLETIAVLKFKISHIPPIWAESYEIVYLGNISMDYFLQIRANEITGLGRDRYSLNIQDTLDATRSNNNRWKVSDYTWQSNDRLRLLATVDDNTGDVVSLYSGTAIGGGFTTSPYDYEIEETGTQYSDVIGGDWLIFQAVDHPDPFEGVSNIIVEIYRPLKGLGKTTAYGTGMVFEIGTDIHGNKYHKGDVDQTFDENGTLINAAEINNTANDCWKYARINYKNNQATIIFPFWTESIFPSDWWSDLIISNKLTSNGFPFLDDLNQRQTVLDERIRNGGYLIIGTRTNNIAHFTFDDYLDLPEKNGDIMGLREVGYTLKIIQMYKETSIYINRIQTFNPDGTEQFTLVESFFGTTRPMEDNYGCQHPDSITVNGRNLYYWDNTEGVFIRSSPNGQIVLDVKMKRYFKDIVRWIQLSGGADTLVVNIGINNDFEEVWITFHMGSEVKGLIFSEKDGRFKSRIDQVTESYIHLGNFFAHLYRQRIWIMNVDEGQDYLTWGGAATYAEFEVVSNAEPMKNKIFNACAVLSDHELTSESKSVTIPEEASACEELMESNIPIFERKEGIFFGKIMKDENSKGIFATVLSKKLNGREMRGRYCFLKFKTEEHTEKVRINSVVIFSTPSERNV